MVQTTESRTWSRHALRPFLVSRLTDVLLSPSLALHLNSSSRPRSSFTLNLTMNTARVEPDLATLSLKDQDNRDPSVTIVPPSPTVPTPASGMVAIAAAENENGPAQPVAFDPAQQQQQQQQQVPSAPPSINSRSSGTGRSHVLTEIPSAYDLLPTPPPTAKNHSSNKLGIARSIDSSSSHSSEAPPSSSGHSSLHHESKHRFERLPNGTHCHNLSAPKRHQFLSSQVRRFKELLEGKKNDKEDHHHDHIKREAMEHPLSLMKEKMQDFEGDSHSPSPNNRKKLTVKEEFSEKYGELQQVVGRGAFGTVRLSIKKNPETGEESVYAIKVRKQHALRALFLLCSRQFVSSCLTRVHTMCVNSFFLSPRSSSTTTTNPKNHICDD